MSTQRTFLESLSLRNFRRFEHLEIEFEEDLTVLVAENGGGKTAVLDGIAVALSSFVDELRDLGSHGFVRDDVRLAQADTGAMVPVTPTSLDACATIDGRRTGWHRELASPAGKTTRASAKELAERASELKRELGDFADKRRAVPPQLPLIAYYGTGRLWSGLKSTAQKVKVAKDLSVQTGAYLDCLSPSSSYGHFRVWFENVTREALNEQGTGIKSPHHPRALLDAVQTATDAVLRPSGWSQLGWDFVRSDVVATHERHGRLPVELLSDGIRNLVALVADLAHRAVRLNPHLAENACRQTPGIVLIDEVDMHLHPAWQQTVIGSLREAFASVQFVVTTHSPLVVSTVPARSLRIVGEDGTISQPTAETGGYDSSFSLGEVFHVSDAPPVEAAGRLAEYRKLIQEGLGDSAEAAVLRDYLIDHFGEGHPAIVETLGLQRLVNLRRERDRKKPT